MSHILTKAVNRDIPYFFAQSVYDNQGAETLRSSTLPRIGRPFGPGGSGKPPRSLCCLQTRRETDSSARNGESIRSSSTVNILEVEEVRGLSTVIRLLGMSESFEFIKLENHDES